MPIRLSSFNILLLTFLGLAFLSCSADKKPIFVSIKRSAAKAVYLMSLDSLGFRVSKQVDFEGNLSVNRLELTTSTEFLIESPLVKDQLRLYLQPGDSIGVSIGGNENDSLFFTVAGSSADFQNYLLQKDQKHRQFETESWATVWEELPNHIADYDKSLQSHRNMQQFGKDLLLYDSLVDWSRSLSIRLRKFQAGASLDTSKINNLFIELQNYHPLLKKSSDFNDFMYSLQSLFLTLNQWQNEHLVEQELQALTISRIQNLNVHPVLISWLKAILLNQISEYGIDGDLGREYFLFIENPQSPQVFANALRDRAGKWVNLSNGSVAPDFTALTTEGDSVKLSNFLGKYLYIDIWASWCKPCIEEFPHSLATMLDPRFEEFTFLFVNMDPQQSAWIKAMERFDIPDGIHLYVPGEWENELFQKYNPTALPRYMIIDPVGKIINVHGPRPSQRDKILQQVQEAIQL